MAQPDLKRTALEVGIWRRNHPTGPMSGLPVELQRNVVKLLESHSWDEVCEAVGINRVSLSVLRKHHREHLQLRRRMVSPKRAARRRGPARCAPKKAEVRLAQVLRLPPRPKDAESHDGAMTHDGRLVVELGGVRVGVLDGFTPSTLGTVLDVVEAWRRKDTR